MQISEAVSFESVTRFKIGWTRARYSACQANSSLASEDRYKTLIALVRLSTNCLSNLV